MGMFKTKTVEVQPAQTTATEEKKETQEAVKKARLLETKGQNKGAELAQNQGQSLRKIFGN